MSYKKARGDHKIHSNDLIYTLWQWVDYPLTMIRTDPLFKHADTRSWNLYWTSETAAWMDFISGHSPALKQICSFLFFLPFRITFQSNTLSPLLVSLCPLAHIVYEDNPWGRRCHIAFELRNSVTHIQFTHLPPTFQLFTLIQLICELLTTADDCNCHKIPVTALEMLCI